MEIIKDTDGDPVDIREVRAVVCDGVSEFSALCFETPDGRPVRLGDTWEAIEADDPDDPFQDPVDGIYGDDEDYWRWAADDRLAEHDVHLGRYHADGDWYELEPHAADTPKGPLTGMTLHGLDLALTAALPEGYESRVILEGTTDERIDVTRTGHDAGRINITVDGWDLADAVADHTGSATPEVVATIADLRQEAEDILENCYGLTFRGPDGDIDTDGLDDFIRDMTDWRGNGYSWDADFVAADGQPGDPIDRAARDAGAADLTDTPGPDTATDGPAAGTTRPGIGI